ncbi:hypothetical protein JKG61_22395 [Sphingobacterium sp. C459-1T]|uniref:ATP-dependent DNA helicase RecG C-terminal domain-containing protein n=1 Tax=Sphingobacterium faecale TaxID=2803775 RepID=A0ABS1RA02_9SPHI|nr:hypothetical protein [Sphingobacterium faecale]
MPEGLSEEEFFDGVSFPRNRELMRVYRDLELVEQLGSGVPRILESYDKECFKFLDNFTRITFPISEANGSYVALIPITAQSVYKIPVLHRVQRLPGYFLPTKDDSSLSVYIRLYTDING